MRPGFRTWSVAAAVSTLGDSVTYFALGWAAAAHGPGVAGLVVTLDSVPLCVLILAGGALADRWGVRRTMIWCDLAMVAVSVAFLLHALGGASVLGLCVVAVAAGTTAALRRPADGAFPRLFVDDEGLARAMASVSLLQQVARTAGPALGGVLLGLGACRWSRGSTRRRTCSWWGCCSESDRRGSRRRPRPSGCCAAYDGRCGPQPTPTSCRCWVRWCCSLRACCRP